MNELKSKKDLNFKKFASEPIKIMYNPINKAGGALSKANENLGTLKTGERYLLINSPTINNSYTIDKKQEDLKINLAHEWGHWNMFQVIGRDGMPSTEYQNHYSFNKDERTSYKEGWGVFQANRYTWGYNMNSKMDTMVQKSKNEDSQYGKKETLYGKSTNATVYHVMRDIYDLSNKYEGDSDNYNIANDVFGKTNNYSNDELEKLSDGLIYIYQ